MRGALFARIRPSHLQAVRAATRGGAAAYRYHSYWEKVREQRKAHRLARLVAALTKIRRNVSMHLSGDEPTRIRPVAVIELIARPRSVPQQNLDAGDLGASEIRHRWGVTDAVDVPEFHGLEPSLPGHAPDAGARTSLPRWHRCSAPDIFRHFGPRSAPRNRRR